MGRHCKGRLDPSTQQDLAPAFSPDGRQVVYQSSRLGSPELYVCNADGSNRRRLTTGTGLVASYSPDWSRDGRWIAFDARSDRGNSLYVVPAQDGVPRDVLGPTRPWAANPSWSADGLIYYTTDGQIWKVRGDGGEPVQVTRQGGTRPRVSPDSETLLYIKPSPGEADTRHAIWRLPIGAGEDQATEVFTLPQELHIGHWTVGEKGIYFLNPDAKPKPMVSLFNFQTKQVEDVVRIEHLIPSAGNGLAVSADGDWLLFSQREDTGSDIMLVENYR